MEKSCTIDTCPFHGQWCWSNSIICGLDFCPKGGSNASEAGPQTAGYPTEKQGLPVLEKEQQDQLAGSGDQEGSRTPSISPKD
jgi:hypothetical protein